MTSEWNTFKVEDIALQRPNALSTGPFGSAISSKFFKETGVPVIRGGNLSTNISNRMSDEGLVFVNEEKAQSFHRSIVRPGDLIFTCWGTINQIGFISKDLKYPEYIISNKQMKLTPDPEKANSLFLYYLFSSPLKQSEILSNGIGAAVPGFNLGQLKNHEVRLPSIQIQNDIAQILDTFDQKIQLNRQINQTLEQIAQAIFKSWFVDFEPTRAKIAARQAGQGPERAEWAAMCAISGKSVAELDKLSPKALKQLKETAALFPDELEDSELGEIPKGWGVTTLNTYCHLNSNSWTKNNTPKCIQYVDLANTKNGVIESTQFFAWKNAPSRARRILKFGDTIIGTVRPGNRSFALIGKNNEQLTGSTGFAVLSPKNADCVEFAYIAATSNSNIERLRHLADGGAYPAIRPDVVANFQLPKINSRLLSYFSQNMKPIFKQRDEYLISNKTLMQLRDTLLPKLLSGEISVKDVA